MFFRSLGQGQNNLTLKEVVISSLDKDGFFFYPSAVAELGMTELNTLVELNQKETAKFLLHYFDTQLPQKILDKIIEDVFEGQDSCAKVLEKTSSSIFLSLTNSYNQNYTSLPVGLTIELFEHYAQTREYSYKKNLFICTTDGAEGTEVLKRSIKYPDSEFLIILPSHANPVYEKYFVAKSSELKNLKVIKINATIDRCRKIERAILASKLTKIRNVCSLSGYNFAYIIGCMMQILFALHEVKFSEVNFSLPFIDAQYLAAIEIIKKMGFNINSLCYAVNSVACIERAMMNGHMFIKPDTIYDTKYNMLNQYHAYLEYSMQSSGASKEYIDSFNKSFLHNENAFLSKDVYDTFHNSFQLFRVSNEELDANVSSMIKKYSQIFDPLTVLGYVLTQNKDNENLNLRNGLPVIFMQFEGHVFFHSYLKEVLNFNIDIDPDLQKYISHETKPILCDTSIEVMTFIKEMLDDAK